MKYVNLVKQTLNEVRSDEYVDLDTFLSLIKKDCKPFLKHKTQLFRGMTGYPSMGKRAVRKDRVPKDSNESESIFINGFLRDNKLPLRSNTMFATTDIGMASVYGDEYQVFPIGNFKCYYFDRIDDVYGQIFSNYRANSYFTTDQLMDVTDENWDTIKKRVGKDAEYLTTKDMWDYMARDINKGMKVEDAIDKYIKFTQTVFDGLPDIENYQEELDGIGEHLQLYAYEPLLYYTTNDIANSGGNEIVIDCKEYYFCGTKVEYNSKTYYTKRILEKELGLIER